MNLAVGSLVWEASAIEALEANINACLVQRRGKASGAFIFANFFAFQILCVIFRIPVLTEAFGYTFFSIVLFLLRRHLSFFFLFLFGFWFRSRFPVPHMGKQFINCLLIHHVFVRVIFHICKWSLQRLCRVTCERLSSLLLLPLIICIHFVRRKLVQLLLKFFLGCFFHSKIPWRCGCRRSSFSQWCFCVLCRLRFLPSPLPCKLCG